MLNCAKYGVLLIMSVTACTVVQAAMTTDHTPMSRRSNMRGEGGINVGSNTMTTIDTPPPPPRQLSEVSELPAAELGNEVLDYRQLRQLRQLIMGGTNASKVQFPSWVDLEGCGGTLIDKYFVLTAAHCVNTPELQARREYIYLGAYTDTSYGTQVKVEEFIIHPGVEDIAILRIGCASRRRVQQLNFDSSIPLNTVRQGRKTVPQALTVIGMGRTSPNGTRSSSLLQTQVSVVPTNVCNASYATFEPIGPNVINGTTMICAGNMETGNSFCKGDSGGPLYIMVPQRLAKIDPPPLVPVQVGIVYFSYPECGSKDFPSVYVRVSAYENFIKSTIAKYYATNPTIKFCSNKST